MYRYVGCVLIIWARKVLSKLDTFRPASVAAHNVTLVTLFIIEFVDPYPFFFPEFLSHSLWVIINIFTGFESYNPQVECCTLHYSVKYNNIFNEIFISRFSMLTPPFFLLSTCDGISHDSILSSVTYSQQWHPFLLGRLLFPPTPSFLHSLILLPPSSVKVSVSFFLLSSFLPSPSLFIKFN